MMATRGHIVTGALQYINMKENINMEESLEIMNKKSGILGISRKSSDLRQVLEEMQNSDDRFRLAVYMVVYRIKKYISSYATALGGIDALCFTGKIGKKSSLIRKKACEDFEFIGVIIENKKNEKTTIDIS